MKKRKQAGYTTADILIAVVAVIVFIAVVLPELKTFTERMQETLELTNLRSAYSLVMQAVIDESSASTVYLDNLNSSSWAEYVGKVGKYYSKEGICFFSAVKMLQSEDGWQSCKYDEKPQFGSAELSSYDTKVVNCKYRYWYVVYNIKTEKLSLKAI